MSITVAVVAQGTMGAGVGAALTKGGARVITSLEGRSVESAARARAAGMQSASDPDMAQADFILSIVPPGDALAFAQRMAPHLRAAGKKPVFADLNAVNPVRYRFATVATDAVTGGLTIGCNTCNAASTAVQPKLGTVEEWTVTNATAADHVFRMHTFPVQVTKINGTTATAISYTDTIKIPRQNSVTFRVSFDDFLGKTVYGSAIASQRDLGAVSTLEVVE